MKWALALLLAAAPVLAAETADPWLSRAPFADVVSRLIPSAELTLLPVSPQAYPASSPFADSARYDDALIAEPRNLAVAAQALSARPADASAIQARLQAAASGKPVSVLTFLPKLVQDLTGRMPERGDEANCFNAALLWDGLMEGPRYADDWELENALEDHFRPLAPGERLRHGDLLTIHSVDHKERLALQHAARYVGGDLFWHKADRTGRTPWTLECLPDMLRPYVERIGRRWVDLEFKVFRLTP